MVPNPDVGTSLVLDTSGSMDLPSGLPGKNRMAVLRDSAPLFVSLLDTTDGVGVVRFDTDASRWRRSSGRRTDHRRRRPTAAHDGDHAARLPTRSG